ncbi:MAG: SAM-dependent methyltransferase [Planctomycetaceae bacterium]
MTQDLASLWTLLETHWREASLLALSLTGPREKSSDLPRRFDVRPVTIAGQLLLQWTATDARKRQTHQNLNWQDSLGKLHALFGPQFSSAHLKTAREDVQIRLLDSGRLQLKHTSRNSAPHAVSANTSDMASHNQSRGYLLPEGRPIPFLKATGIMTETGQVRQAMYRKFRQINRFVEFVFDLRDRFPRDRPVRIVDYGCGKSYLTFAVRHLLVETLGLRVDMLGLDSNPDVIAACLKTREQLGWTDLDFQVNSIAQAEMQPPIDLALWLHACDTATDQAIARSVQLEAELILAVPCCQHELHHQLQNEMLAPLLAWHPPRTPRSPLHRRSPRPASRGTRLSHAGDGIHRSRTYRQKSAVAGLPRAAKYHAADGGLEQVPGAETGAADLALCPRTLTGESLRRHSLPYPRVTPAMR